jgi:hypothetical protein
MLNCARNASVIVVTFRTTPGSSRGNLDTDNVSTVYCFCNSMQLLLGETNIDVNSF